MLKVGVIGCGGMGKDHIDRITNRTQGAEVVAVSDVNVEGAKEAAAMVGPDVKIYESGTELINDPDVDAVMIVSPGVVHHDDLIEAIKAGKRVFCEKPLCATAEECKEVMEAEEEAGKHLVQVGFMRRYHKGYNQIKDEIATGEYGEPLIVHCTHRSAQQAPDYSTPMAVYDTAIHEIDLLHWLVGDDYDTVQVVMPRSSKNANPGLKDPQIMLITTKNGIVIDLECFGNCQFGYDINCEVVCEDGSIKMGAPMSPSIRKSLKVSESIPVDWFDLFNDAYDAEVQNWVDRAEEGVIEGPTAWDGYLAAVTADALVKAQETGAIEKVETVEKPDFYA